MSRMAQEFKEFAMRGNVLDLAAGVIIGGAFGKIVTSLVQDIIMPLVGLLLGGISFQHLQLVMGNTALMYGSFIQSVVDFLIIAFSIFAFIKVIGRFKKAEKTAPPAPPAPSNEELLLAEIRDLLKADDTR